MEENKITIKMAPHKTEQLTKINTKSACTYKLIKVTIAEIERQSPL